MIGAIIDQFKIAQALGKNPVSEVFLAVHSRSGEKFVLEAIIQKVLAQPGFKEQLLEDVVNIIKLEHPNVVPLTNLLEEQGRLFTVRQFVEGQRLSEMIEQQGVGTPVIGFLRLFRDVLKGIGYGHAEGYTHRFLCPKKILITPDREVLIYDFGTVIQKEKERRRKRAQLMDYAPYFSPERFINPETTDIRTNIYALGVILFEMVTGRTPFRSETYEELYKLHARSRVPDPRALNPNIPDGVVGAITKAMAKKPEKRFQTTIEFYKALADVDEMDEPDVLEESLAAPVFNIETEAPPSTFQIDPPQEDTDISVNFDLVSEEAEAKASPEPESFDFGFGEPPMEEAQPWEEERDFGGGDQENTATPDDGFSFSDTGAETPAESGFSFGDDETPAASDGFNFGGDDAPADTGFGFDDAAAPAADNFDFGGGGAPASEPDDQGFDFGGTDADPVPADQGFDFGGTDADPVPADQGFDFGGTDAAPAPADQGFDFGGADADPAPADQGFAFGDDDPSKTADDDFAFVGEDPAETADEKFSFGSGDGGSYGLADSHAEEPEGFAFDEEKVDPYDNSLGLDTLSLTGAVAKNEEEAAALLKEEEDKTDFTLGGEQDLSMPEPTTFDNLDMGDNRAPTALEAAFAREEESMQGGTADDFFGVENETMPADTGFAFGDDGPQDDEQGFDFNIDDSHENTDPGANTMKPDTGFDLGGPADDLAQTGHEQAGDPFGFDDQPAQTPETASPAGDETPGGFDFNSTVPMQSPANDAGFDFGGDTPAADGFDLGGGSDNNEFDLGGDPGGNAFDMGAGEGADGFGAPSADGFSFGSDEAPASGGDDGFSFGGDDAAPASGGDDGFSFGGDDAAPASGGDDGFSFGGDDAAAPAGGDDGFSFGGDDAAPSGGDDGFSFGGDDAAAPAGGDDGFSFGGDEFSHESPSQSLTEGGSDFDFAAESSPEISSDDAGFTFGGEDPFEGGDSPFEEPDQGGGSDFSALDQAEPSFADLDTADDGFGDFASAEPATAPASDQLATDDGAFSFEAIPDEEPAADVMADGATAKKGLEDSIAMMEAEEKSKSKKDKTTSKPARPKIVKKFDKKVLGLTVGLAIVLISAIGFWWTSRQSSKQEDEVFSRVQNLASIQKFDEALSAINSELGQDHSNSLKSRLTALRAKIESDKKEQGVQISNLLERAETYKSEGKVFTDGKNDALGAYLTILSKDPKHTDAYEAVTEIKSEQLVNVQQDLEKGRELEALSTLELLARADRSDQQIQAQYNELKEKLKDEKAGLLEKKIGDLYSAQKYSPIVPLLSELTQIDPNSQFVKDMRKSLITAFENQGKDFTSRGRYDEAEKAYRNSLKLNPNNKKIETALADVEEQRLRSSIERTTGQLERAVDNDKLKEKYQLANKLAELDPGNPLANTVMEGALKELGELRREAEKMRSMGQFKQAADYFQKIYDIEGSEDARQKWQKYARWAPPPRMTFLPQGSFKRGRNNVRDARPAHEVFISNFFIDQYEVTNAEFKEFIDAKPEWHPSNISPDLHDGNYLKHWVNGAPTARDANRPVTYVSWFAANAYAKFRGKRLPTEAEWEKAAAGNTTKQKFWWGDYSDAKMAVYEFYPEKQPAEVGSFPANGYSVHEILGNVNEWVVDAYDPKFYKTTDEARNPVNNPEQAGERVFRGGSFKSRGRDLALFLRFHKSPKTCSSSLGFRCAMDSNDQ